MSRPILVAHAPGSTDPGVVDFAAAAAGLTGAPVVLVSVRAGGSLIDRMAGGELRHGAGGDADADGLLERLTAAGVAPELRVVEDSTAARGLAAAIDDLSPRLVIVGSTRRGRVGRVLAGSTAERVIHGAAAPVAVVPHGYRLPEHGVRTIGAAFVPSPEGHAALRAAADLARGVGGRLRGVMVLSPKHADEGSAGQLSSLPESQRPAVDGSVTGRLAAEAALETALAELAQGVDAEPDVLFQDPVEGLDAASELLDLLVLGSRAYGPMHAILLGGVSRRVIATAACPVLVLPRGADGLGPAAATGRATARPAAGL